MQKYESYLYTYRRLDDLRSISVQFALIALNMMERFSKGKGILYNLVAFLVCARVGLTLSSVNSKQFILIHIKQETASAKNEGVHYNSQYEHAFCILLTTFSL